MPCVCSAAGDVKSKVVSNTVKYVIVQRILNIIYLSGYIVFSGSLLLSELVTTFTTRMFTSQLRPKRWGRVTRAEESERSLRTFNCYI